MSTDYKLVAVGGGDGVIPLDTDGTFAANSDKRVATQQAVKEYVDGKLDVNMTAGAGFAGTGTVYKTSVVQEGDFYRTRIFIDLTGAASSTTDLDIIGTDGVSYIGQITAAVNGTIVAGTMTCLEVPTGGADDIDLYSAVEGTGAFDGGIAALDETALVTSGGAWTLGETMGLAAMPAADEYLYLCGGESGTAATYTAGKFIIELWGV